ncbi:hypothetical protein M0805_000634 [Coniferiporia weirii]|nr:hypothetical protein M0805_000634 [Coniferiporia weirii]
MSTTMLILRFLLCTVALGAFGAVAQETQVPLRPADASGVVRSREKILSPEFTDYVHHLMDLWNVKGAAIAVVKPGGEVELGAYGVKTEDGERMTPDTLFGIASCSKAFLSSSLGILFDDYAHGRNSTPLPETLSELNWETKIRDVLPGEWELQDKWASEKANFRDILSHMSGMPRHGSSYRPGDSTVDITRRLKYLRPAHELRQKFSYNNQMYMIGAHIITKYAGSYIDFATERILNPLGMNSTTFSPLAASLSGRQTQTWTMHGQRIPNWMTEEVKEFNAGPGGVITSVVDLSKWIKMLLNSGVDPITGTSIISRSVFDAITISSAIDQGKASGPGFSIIGYGMGWQRSSYQGHEEGFNLLCVVLHGGAIPGISSIVSFFPGDDFGIAVILNTGDRGRVTLALSSRIAEDLLGLPHMFSAEEPPSSPTPVPRNSTAPLPLKAYAGTYNNPGYGAFTLCEPTASSHYCTEVLTAFRAVDSARGAPLPPGAEAPQLFGAWPRLWSSHVRLVYAEENTFDIALTALFPEGYGASKTPFEMFELDQYEGQVVFVVNAKGVVEGFGLYGTGDMEGKRSENVSVREGAIAWFDKV